MNDLAKAEMMKRHGWQTWIMGSDRSIFFKVFAGKPDRPMRPLEISWPEFMRENPFAEIEILVERACRD